jgi:hypothetical protein
MNNISRRLWIFSLVMLIAISAIAQDYHTFEASEAVIFQSNGDNHSERFLKKTIISLTNSTHLLSVKLYIPCPSINHIPADTAMFSSPGLIANLRMIINPWQIQDELTSANVFTTQGLFTLNNITKTVTVEYIPLPAGPEQEGDFNLSMKIQFTAGDFNLGEKNNNCHFIIKIGNAAVNRI